MDLGWHLDDVVADEDAVHTEEFHRILYKPTPLTDSGKLFHLYTVLTFVR